MPQSTPDHLLDRYDAAAIHAAHQIITSYSTSFSLATRLLRGHVRTDVRNLYAIVRIADEIVDGTASGAGLTVAEAAAALDAYEDAVLAAPQQRFHTDPALHAWGISARRCGFSPDHVRAFFGSMRRDLQVANHDAQSFDNYIYGSAEVIGLMCLDIFLAHHPVAPEQKERLAHGARRLGAAFQKINFLRDLAEDTQLLGRTYFPQLADGQLTDSAKDALVADIRADLSAAYAVIPQLPLDARVGVQAAADFFAELTDRIDALPAAEVATRRVSVPSARKSFIMARAIRRAARRATASGAHTP